MKTILLVQDNVLRQKIITMYLKDTLKPGSYSLLIAENGAAGVELFKANKNTIDFVIMDFNMPIMEGGEATKEIIKIDADALIIGWTETKTDSTERKKMIEAGINHFLTSTLNREQFEIQLKEFGLIEPSHLN